MTTQDGGETHNTVIAETVSGSVIQARVISGGIEQHIYYEDGAARRTHRAETAVGEECPYPGLTAFSVDQARWFFGRDALTAQLVSRLDEHTEAGGMLIVVAPSGAGKSSLLRAGLVRKLADGALPGSRRWPVVVFTPTDSPMSALGDHLVKSCGLEPIALKAAMAGDPRICISMVRNAVGTDEDTADVHRRLVVIVDQFEEVFSAGVDEDERRRFVETLSGLATADEGRAPAAIVVCGLRSDFYSPCAAYPQLRDALQTRQTLVGPMSIDELREAILFPARDVGLRFEAGLINVLLDDLGVNQDHAASGYEVGRLPLLAHALRATWRERRGSVLTVDGYLASGGIHYAVATTADKAFLSLGSADQVTARTLLLRLVKVSTNGSEDTRHRRLREELVAGLEPPSARTVLRVFADGRLLTQQTDTVEITHEVLLTAWPRLRSWVAEDRARLIARQQLVEAVDLWEGENRDSDYLYRGSRLAAVQEWFCDSSHRHDLNDSEIAFVDASNEREGRQRELEARHRRRQRRLNIILALLLVATTTTSVVVYRQSRLARAQSVLAEANALRSSAPRVAMQLTILAARLGDSDARTVLTEQLDQDLRYSFQTGSDSLSPIAFSPTRQYGIGVLATGGPFGIPGVKSYWEGPSMGSDSETLAGKVADVTDLAFDTSGSVLAGLSTKNQTVTIWQGDFLGHPQVVSSVTLPPPIAPIDRVAIGADARLFAIASGPRGNDRHGVFPDSPVILFRVAGDGVQYSPLPLRGEMGMFVGVDGLAFSSRGDILATTGLHNDSLWDVSDLSHPQRIADLVPPTERETFEKVAFSPDGNTLVAVSAVSSSGSTMVTLFDVSSPARPVEEIKVPMPRGERIDQVSFSNDGRTLAVAYNDGIGATVELWDIANPSQVGRFNSVHAGSNSNIAFSRSIYPRIEQTRKYMEEHSDNLLAVAGGSGSVDLWVVDQLKEVGADPIKAACAEMGSDSEIKDAVWTRYLADVSRQPICS
ncbi:WD40 repeat domain-containing protein [Amycolatopsis sp. CA-126428]|uniref:WD40 repeat domain-containing protein n=1 Tax=Amycolatopsis sp. CA-126428 TaxID=2073158 RepID=UPI000CD01943|nr:WD40 repeat domain-containing protein [Amycolatopsis sp. CA-126428]